MIQFMVTFDNKETIFFDAPSRAELSNQYKQWAEKYSTKVIDVCEIARFEYSYKLIPTNTTLTADKLYKLYLLSYPNREETFAHFIYEHEDTIKLISEI